MPRWLLPMAALVFPCLWGGVVYWLWQRLGLGRRAGSTNAEDAEARRNLRSIDYQI